MAEEPTSPPNLVDILRDTLPQLRDTAADLLLPLWPLWLGLAAVFAVRLLLFLRRQRRLTRSGIRDIDAMDGTTFERYLATMFRRLGYHVEHVGSARGDYGGDLVIRKNGTRTVVQAKRYGRRKVGIKAVQEAHTAKAMYECSRAMVVTNGAFSEQARQTARANGVELWGRDELVATLLHARGAVGPARASVEPVAADTAPDASQASVVVLEPPAICARCGIEVSTKVRDYCRAHADRFGGLVYCYAHQRSFRRRTG